MELPLILVAEDERDIRELIVITLQTHGLTNVIQAINGEEAVAKAKAQEPGLILMDVRMPKMTGYEACQVLKDDPLTSEIPVVFLSAKGQDAEIKRGKALGAEEYILKPFAPDELVTRVVNILKRSGYQVPSS
ncbi:MAG: response regulator [Anaerolineales bacterium]|nr:MAG: response regulator [Anaerolineales bacterium]